QLISHGYWDGVRVWDAATGWEVRNLLAKSGDWIGGVWLSPDGKFVFTLERDQKGNLIRVRNWADLKQVGQFAVEYRQSPQLAPDGKILAGPADNGRRIEIWDVAAGRRLSSWKGHGGPDCQAFSPDGKTLVTAGADKAIRFWDVGTGQQKREIITP